MREKKFGEVFAGGNEKRRIIEGVSLEKLIKKSNKKGVERKKIEEGRRLA